MSTKKEGTKTTKAEQTNEAAKREFKEVSAMRGTVKIFEMENETLTGLATLKEGRPIGEEEMPTIEVFDTINGVLYLIPASSVIKSKWEKAVNDFGGELFYARIQYLGKKATRDGKREYHDYSLAVAEATQDDLMKLANFEELNS